MIITIEGSIGAGKSTLINKLKNLFHDNDEIIFLDEPIKLWESIADDNENILQKFYNNQTKYSFAFQILTGITILKNIKDTLKENPKAIIIMERSVYTGKCIFSKMLYDNKHIEDVEMQTYLMWYDQYASDFEPDAIIYLDTSPKICKERIQIRNRTGEKDISIKYLKQCHQYHQTMCKFFHNSNNIITIDADQTLCDEVINEWTSSITKFILRTLFKKIEK